MEQQIKPGDIVRLTDPISNGEVVRIESVNEYGFASWLGGSQAADMEQITILDGASPIGNDIDGYFFLVSEIVEEIEKRVNAQTWLNLKRPFKLYPESAVEYWKQRAEVEKKEHAYYEQAWEKEHNKLLDAQDEIAKLKEYIKKVCAESSADIQKLDAENKKLKERIKQLEADIEEGGFNDERNFI